MTVSRAGCASDCELRTGRQALILISWEKDKRGDDGTRTLQRELGIVGGLLARHHDDTAGYGPVDSPVTCSKTQRGSAGEASGDKIYDLLRSVSAAVVAGAARSRYDDANIPMSRSLTSADFC